jgi:peptidoglycan/LPS O-acetylase OafA/YrhL
MHNPNMHYERDSEMSAAPEPLIRPVMPELDTLRGIAILGVLIYHGLYWNIGLTKFAPRAQAVLTFAGLGVLGVDLFFVLSGFLITGILLRSRSQQTYYKRFYIRRALRIFPAYLLIILVLIASRKTTFAFAALSLAYLSNLTPLVGVPISYPVLWSLAVEEHFYFLWPFLVRRLSKLGVVAVCAAIIVLTPFSRLMSYYAASHKTFDKFIWNQYTWNALDGLACGAALSIWLNGYAVKRRSLLNLSYLLLAVTGLMWVTLWHWGIATRRNALGAALRVVPWNFAFTAILGLFLLIGTTEHKRIVQSAPLQFLGRISYGLYLVHLLMFDVVDYLGKHGLPGIGKTTPGPLIWRASLAWTSSILIAFLSRKYFEDRFLSLKTRYS